MNILDNLEDIDAGFLKIINDNKHICTSIDTMSSSRNFSYLINKSYSPQWNMTNNNYHHFFKNSKSLLFIDNKVKRNYIKIFLGEGEPNDPFKGWSPEMPITISIKQIDSLLKLKCFL